MNKHQTLQLVEPEVMNHHSTLYAGAAAGWLIDIGFVAAVKERGITEGMVYKNTHEYDFKVPFEAGSIVALDAIIVRAGKTSVTTRCSMYDYMTGEVHGEAYMTFVCIDEATGEKLETGITLDETTDEEELAWRKKAQSFFE